MNPLAIVGIVAGMVGFWVGWASRDRMRSDRGYELEAFNAGWAFAQVQRSGPMVLWGDDEGEHLALHAEAGARREIQA